MSSIILDQLNDINTLRLNGLITDSEAKEGMFRVDYKQYISEILKKD